MLRRKLALLLLLGIVPAAAPAPAAAARPEPGARYADTDYAFWADLRVSRSGRWLDPRRSTIANVSDWQCPGLDVHVGTPRRPVRIRPSGRFRYVRRRGRFVLVVSGRFRSRNVAVVSFRYLREPRRRGRECDDSGGVSLAPRRVVPLGLIDCRTHEAPTILTTPAGRVFRHDAWGGADGWGTATYACLFEAGRPFRLGQDDDDDSDLGQFRLVEPYVAFEHIECSMGCFNSVHVVDLRDGAVRHLPDPPGGPFGRLTDLELRATGSAAWIAHPAQYSPETQPSVWADQGAGTIRLDMGAIEPESLELNGSALTWIRDGAPQSATLD